MGNPFQDAYDAVASTLANSAGVTALVSVNVIRLDDDLEPLIDDYNAGDLPLLRLTLADSGERNLHASSQSADMPMALQLEYVTDREELAATAGLFALDWVVLRCLAAALPNFGCRYITKFELGGFTPQEPREVAEPQETGWRATMPIILYLSINHNEIKE